MENSIYTCFWYDGQAKEAAEFYGTLFKNSRILSADPMVVMFEINGMKIMGLNGGPMFKFNESVSLVVECKDQAEIDFLWERLTADGGQESQCGWCKDKFGFSWQIIPQILGQLMSDPSRRDRVIQAFMQMRKFDIATLLNA